MVYDVQVRLKIGDLVRLAGDVHNAYGFGIILDKHSHGDWEVYWFGDSTTDIEVDSYLEKVELPDDSE